MHIVKIHSLGNDYLVVDYQEKINYSKLAKRICDRRIGVGADGLVVVKTKPHDFDIYSYDGKEIRRSVNGVLCYLKYCLDCGYIKKNKFDVNTEIGKVKAKILNEKPFVASFDMGSPIYNNQALYISDPLDAFGRILSIGDSNITSYSAFLDDVHTVIIVDDFKCSVLKKSREISNYKIFNRNTNVNFVKVIDRNTIEVKTFEKNNGWVLSSGSGSAVSLSVLYRLGMVESSVVVNQQYGNYNIEINKKGELFICGPAIKVFECELKEEELC